MVSTLDMQDLRYLNLFTRITRVNTRYFFMYNNMLVFFVPKRLVSKALGDSASNLKKMSEIVSIGHAVPVYGRQAGSGVPDALGFTRSQGSDSIRKETSRRVDNPIRVNDKHNTAQTEEQSQTSRMRHLKFEIQEDTNKVVVKVIDTDTGDTIREIPPEHMRRVADRIAEMGKMLDERA